ncbi:MAG: hypothetical protein A2268_10030 [Candidatus Raymondbacteria bacterium RifOxyA12_full_50_37]|uniref:Uncharacterized protein TP-0789 domain-containing protein n=1 Tax=Candidatus Raymondbacteria bacterium RIFOXYD12_FULL_49_13 TaxID=1817890 RepID=A0A1F7F4A1_UNCRA|nr:MAG: hypothetical protein A2268_10030 [Candidatus Raymondbacteria bacterium RifOxyA12_full_50_37]OGJ93824.1 MAG: hypothetical protein A2248_06270 [Candidatus Raymondbacteria bacterium RIFOXYA2_FULL_49_16]OGJ98309.1 MAG: hypothetical protein A2453_00905 [Candidatus Raymondbacteria bacterium RIFOXYC2_FULL_50_21]OGK01392.1 MAG: hypothetical protein A2519_14860 [Candidatus Raymondbacteria bacterium RIFOXYD12_FULL_49_13]OGK04085.1 MAG: hypothetical protein A2350_05095 [Candidatus Raymondbacteria 
MIVKVLVAALLLAANIQAVFALTALEIMEKVDTKAEPKDVRSDMTMTLIDKNGGERKRTIRMIRQGSEKQIMWFLEPADVRGTSFLKVEQKGDFDDMRLYLPAFKKVRRISSSAKSESFMGSDFTYEDMTKRKIEEYDYTQLSDSTIDGKVCFAVESKVKSGIKTDYRRIVSFIWKDEFIILYEKLYDKRDQLLKIRTVGDFEKIKNYQIMKLIRIDNVQKNHVTILTLANITVDGNVDPGLFHERNLQKMPQ